MDYVIPADIETTTGSHAFPVPIGTGRDVNTGLQQTINGEMEITFQIYQRPGFVIPLCAEEEPAYEEVNWNQGRSEVLLVGGCIEEIYLILQQTKKLPEITTLPLFLKAVCPLFYIQNVAELELYFPTIQGTTI